MIIRKHSWLTVIEIPCNWRLGGKRRYVFPSISTGVYSFPIDLAAKTAISTIKDFLADHNFGNVTMVLFSDNDYEAYVSALKNLSDS